MHLFLRFASHNRRQGQEIFLPMKAWQRAFGEFNHQFLSLSFLLSTNSDGEQIFSWQKTTVTISIVSAVLTDLVLTDVLWYPNVVSKWLFPNVNHFEHWTQSPQDYLFINLFCLEHNKIHYTNRVMLNCYIYYLIKDNLRFWRTFIFTCTDYIYCIYCIWCINSHYIITLNKCIIFLY